MIVFPLFLYFTQQFFEVPSVGIYKVCFKGSTSNNNNYCIKVIPWKKAVWPGSLDVVKHNEEFRNRLYPGMVEKRLLFSNKKLLETVFVADHIIL